MPKDFHTFSISADGPAARKAAGIFTEALIRRGAAADAAGETVFSFTENAGFPCDDCFGIDETTRGFAFAANGVRGLIYAAGLFLRKAVCRAERIALACPIGGTYQPKKAIRGHQLGYRPINNTYDKWAAPDFERYMTELMFFGMNTVEFIPLTEKNDLMRCDGPQMTAILSEKAHGLGLAVSLWIPNGDGTEEEELRERAALFAAVPYIDTVFIPGSDPGDLPAEELILRCIKIRGVLARFHPKAELWVSAQRPHNAHSWGEEFLRALEKYDNGEIAGVIQGPNRAFSTKELRERLPEKYPLRFYPDITHNLRCEHPVHFDKDDWHYAFAAAFSRESVNPRPAEYVRLFHTVSPYTVGSVTYSDGVNDDVNKTVWCAMEWDDALSAEEIAADYARAYLYDHDTDKSAAAVLMLERNWEGSPAERCIDAAYALVKSIDKESGNWRFLQLFFRAAGDKYVKERFLADTAAAEYAKAMLRAGDTDAAKAALTAPPPPQVTALREEIEEAAKGLYDTIGMQLSVEKYGASGWERGAVLDTIDLPVTDRQWLAHLLETDIGAAGALRAANRNEVRAHEFYFSVALHGLGALGAAQAPDFYMNILADRPNVNDGTLPVCLFKVYDHFSLRAVIGGLLPGRDYELRVTYYKPDESFLRSHTAKANGATLERPVSDAAFTRLLPRNFSAYVYTVPAALMNEARLELEIEEPVKGFQFAEFYVLLKEENA